jgi:hypothetical protein
MLSKSPLSVAIFVTFVVMLTMSIIALWAERPANQPAENDFAGGFQEGFATAAAASTLSSAIIFGVIAGFRRTRAMIVGATILIVLAAFHFQRYANTFPSIADAAWSLAPKMVSDLLLRPINWVNYFIAYRAYRERALGDCVIIERDHRL